MIKKYLKKIKKNIYNNDSFNEEEILEQIQKCEERLKISLPIPLKEMYSVFGNHDDILNVYHTFYKINDLKIMNDALVFFEFIDKYSKYGILMEDLKEDDPVVSLQEVNDDEWYFESESLSEYIVNNIFWNGLNFMKFKAKVKIKEENLKEHCEGILYRFAPEKEFDVTNKYSYYDKDEKVMATYFYYGQSIILGSNDKERLEQLEKSMNLKFEWIEGKITNDDIFN